MKTLPVVLLSLLLSLTGFSQEGKLIKKLDSLTVKADSAGQKNNTADTAYNERTKITFRSYFTLLGSNLKQQFTKPFHMNRKDWGKFAAFGLTEVALGFADEPIQKQALKLRGDNMRALNASKYISKFGGLYEFYTLGGLGLYGFIFKNEKMKTTTLLASQAYITGSVMESVLKYVSGRTRPSYYNPAVEAEPTFKGPFGKTSKNYLGKRSNSSFPSGHATVAFAAATVYAMEYKKTPWVPIFSYTFASLISVSRITENRHWMTDVFAGAVLGYLSGRQIVNNYHRYAKIKSTAPKKNTVSFNLQYNSGQLQPGLVYHIK